MRTLAVTSPLMHGNDVKHAQTALKAGNIYATDYLHGAIDGVFGQETGRGCIRAKFWLGYPQSEMKPVYGDTLDALLTGKRKLPLTYQARRRARLEAAQQKPLGQRALDQLAPYVGETESPAGSNWSFASRWYGLQGPWCAMTVTYGYVKAGSKAFVRGSRYAYVPYIVIDARAGANGLSVTKTPRAGDLGCVDWQRGDGRNPYSYDHVLMFQHWVDPGASFKSREGNTSFDDKGDQSNGGAMADRTRRLSTMTVEWVRVGR